MLGPVWIPLESISGPKNMAAVGGKIEMAFDGRMIWVLVAKRRIQLIHPAGALMSPLMPKLG